MDDNRTVDPIFQQKPKVSTSGRDPVTPDGSAPEPIDPASGQHTAYWVLPDEERKKGFVRPLRTTYKHVGVLPKYPTRELTPEERERYAQFGYVRFEAYPEDSPEAQGGNLTGRFWTEPQLKGGCGSITSMGRSIAETYARDPGFYSHTFCFKCRDHLPVTEFRWEPDGSVVGS